jgi:hypothetical protein
MLNIRLTGYVHILSISTYVEPHAILGIHLIPVHINPFVFRQERRVIHIDFAIQLIVAADYVVV